MTTVKHTLTALLGILCLFVNAQVKTDFNSDKLITGRGLFLKNYKDQTDFEVPAKNIDQLLEKEKFSLSTSVHNCIQ